MSGILIEIKDKMIGNTYYRDEWENKFGPVKECSIVGCKETDSNMIIGKRVKPTSQDRDIIIPMCLEHNSLYSEIKFDYMKPNADYLIVKA